MHKTSKLEAPCAILHECATVEYKMFFDTFLQPTRSMVIAIRQSVLFYSPHIAIADLSKNDFEDM